MKTFLRTGILRSIMLTQLILASTEIIAQDQCINLDNFLKINQNLSVDKLVHGDYNGDNLDDIGFYDYNHTATIRIVYGNAGTLQIADSIQLNSYYHVSSPGDINGDNYDDLLISSGNKILVYKGTSSGLELDQNLSIDLSLLNNTTDPNTIGYAERYRDINGDGIMDILVNAGPKDYSVRGNLYVLQSSLTGFSKIAEFSGNDFNFYFQTSFKNLGDLNADGFTDIGFTGGLSFLDFFYGDENFFDPMKKSQINFSNEFEYPEISSFSNVGDVNNDGYNDVLLSRSQYWDESAALLYLGSSSGVTNTVANYFNDSIVDYLIGEGFGMVSGPAGDVNGDGIDDFFIGGGPKNYTRIFYGNTNVAQIKPEVNIGISPRNMIPAGDLNGDGNNDWVASFSKSQFEKYIVTFNGSSSGITGVFECKKSDLPYALNIYGMSGQSAGDVNNDGFDDILVGHVEVDKTLFDDVGQIEVITGAPVGRGTGGMVFNAGLFETFGDQIGSGDFNGDGYSDVIAGRYGVQTIYVFYGSPAGIDNVPDLLLTEEMNAGWGESIEDIGDLNNDGFDDFLAFGMNGMTLMIGSPTGPQVFQGWNNPSFIAYKAGDGNNDGFADFFLRTPEGSRLFRGSATGPVMDPFIYNLPLSFAGDVNSDGFDDMLSLDRTNNTIGLLLGNATGYTDAGISILNSFNPNGIGDFNGDGFDDIAVATNLDSIDFYGGPSRVDIYLGNASGIETNIFRTIRAQLKHNPLLPQPRVGDFNKDGKEDLLVSAGYESFLVYGIGGIPTITCPSETSLYADSTCIAEVSGVDPPGNPSLYNYSVTGYKVFEGTGSLNGMKLNAGTYFVTYSLISNPQQQCSFTLRILDTLALKLVVPNSLVLCGNTNMNVNVPLLKIEQDCQIATITYQLTGATSRSGNGLDASGNFNKGTTIITWTVTDSSGNTSVGKMNVSILGNNFVVRIPKAYQINAQQSQANTIYLGYANNTLRLTAYEPNSARHKYLWSNGDTTRFTRVRHNVPGTYEYSVIVTNDNGCSDTAYTTIKVVDNYCPNPIKDFITQYFPQLLNQPWIQALIASTSQLYLCYNGSTVCVNPAAVPAMISNGARLGKCGVIYESNDMITAKEETNSVGALTLTASPNPSGYEFTLKIDGTKGKPYALRIVNSVGSPVFMKQGITENIVRAGGSFQKGVYFAEVICGNERKVIKLLKVR